MMITIKKRPPGFVLIFKSVICLEDVRKLTFQLRDEAAGLHQPFFLVFDTRRLSAFAADAHAEFESLLEEAYESLGLGKISVLGVSTAHANFFCNMMVRTELMDIYQFLDLAYEEDWKEQMDAWLEEGVTAG